MFGLETTKKVDLSNNTWGFARNYTIGCLSNLCAYALTTFGVDWGRTIGQNRSFHSGLILKIAIRHVEVLLFF